MAKPHTVKFRILNMVYTSDLGSEDTIAYRVLTDDLSKKVRIQNCVSVSYVDYIM